MDVHNNYGEACSSSDSDKSEDENGTVPIMDERLGDVGNDMDSDDAVQVNISSLLPCADCSIMWNLSHISSDVFTLNLEPLWKPFNFTTK